MTVKGPGDLRVLVGIPAYNCEHSVAAVVGQCLSHLADVLVIDDGSQDATGAAAGHAGARVLFHSTNMGKGAAIATAAGEALRGGFSALLTLDGDGQHDADDLPQFLQAHRASPDTLWVGWRKEALRCAPSARRFGNRFSNQALELLSGVRLPDTQCGMRLYPASLLRRVSLQGSRYEAEAELLVRAAAMHWDMRALPVRVRFPDGRATSHYRPWLDTARICTAVVRLSVKHRLARARWVAAAMAAAHAPLAAAAVGALNTAAAAAPALAFHLAMSRSLLRPRGQMWVQTEAGFRATPGRSEVALTFDDGPDPRVTPALLDLLERKQVPATFFVIGRHVDEFPQLVAETAARGHAVGNHTYHHRPAFCVLGRAALTGEVDRAQEAIERACGRRPVVLRPPAGHKNVHLGGILLQRRMRCVSWSVRAFDTLRRNPVRVSNILARKARSGSILLLHDGGGSVASVLETVRILIERLAARGFRFVTLPGAS